MKYYKLISDFFHNAIDEIIKNNETYGPAKKVDKYEFRRLRNFDELIIDNYIPTILPPTKFLLPQEEVIAETNLLTKETKPVFYEKEILLIGVRPCDLDAIDLLDIIMNEGNADPNYVERRKHITIIGFDCESSCDNHSLCKAVGSINRNKGYDIFFSKFNNGYVIKVATAKGEEIFNKYIKEAVAMRENEIAEYEQAREERVKNFNNIVKFSVDENLPAIFWEEYDNKYWKKLGEKCLVCGSCNMVCPTCYCFTIYEETDLKLTKSEKKRKWDGCMLRSFAMVAGGHNFRPSADMRLQHRWNRKFNYLMEKYGRSNCVGCGRCSRACLVNINPIDILNNILGDYYKKKER